MFLAGASYFLRRVVHRELAVVRQQQDFVAAVSHGFRTPLTSLRHTAELLQESDDVPPAKRHAFYDALGRNTERLRRLVESLLDFSRMEGGKKPYDLQPIDAGELVGHIVAEFQQEVGPQGVTVRLDVENGAALSVGGDAAALTNAIWNLLDNAVKYSPDARTVHVSVARYRAGVAIAIRDEGLGIPANERKDVFQRFVRGQQATRLAYILERVPKEAVSRSIVIHSVATREEREVVPKLRIQNGFLRWSPDGRFLLVRGSDAAHPFGCYTLDATTGEVVDEMPNGYLAGWSADGRYLFFVCSNITTNGSELWRGAASGGEPQALHLGVTSQFSVHPDGRRMAFGAGNYRTEVWAMANFLPKPAAPGAKAK